MIQVGPLLHEIPFLISKNYFILTASMISTISSSQFKRPASRIRLLSPVCKSAGRTRTTVLSFTREEGLQWSENYAIGRRMSSTTPDYSSRMIQEDYFLNQLIFIHPCEIFEPSKGYTCTCIFYCFQFSQYSHGCYRLRRTKQVFKYYPYRFSHLYIIIKNQLYPSI